MKGGNGTLRDGNGYVHVLYPSFKLQYNKHIIKQVCDQGFTGVWRQSIVTPRLPWEHGHIPVQNESKKKRQMSIIKVKMVR